VLKCLVEPGSIELIGTAGELGATAPPDAEAAMGVRTATSSTVPQLPQSGHRPTHFAVT
jgi:hypothetical protein